MNSSKNTINSSKSKLNCKKKNKKKIKKTAFFIKVKLNFRKE